MNKYNVFWIKEEFAHRYFYKHEILYRFLKTYQSNNKNQDLLNQYNHITYNFSKKLLMSHFEKVIQQPWIVEIEKNTIKIYNTKNSSHIDLHIYKKHLEFYCKSLDKVEELLFPILRNYQSLLFITNNKTDNFGWISPVISNNEYKNSPKLYSYL